MNSRDDHGSASPPTYRQCRLVSQTRLRGQSTVKRSTRRHGPSGATRHDPHAAPRAVAGCGTSATASTTAAMAVATRMVVTSDMRSSLWTMKRLARPQHREIAHPADCDGAECKSLCVRHERRERFPGRNALVAIGPAGSERRKFTVACVSAGNSCGGGAPIDLCRRDPSIGGGGEPRQRIDVVKFFDEIGGRIRVVSRAVGRV